MLETNVCNDLSVVKKARMMGKRKEKIAVDVGWWQYTKTESHTDNSHLCLMFALTFWQALGEVMELFSVCYPPTTPQTPPGFFQSEEAKCM